MLELFGDDSSLIGSAPSEREKKRKKRKKKTLHVRTLSASVGGFEPMRIPGETVLWPQPYEHDHPPNGRVTVHKSGPLYLNASDATPYIMNTLIKSYDKATYNGKFIW